MSINVRVCHGKSGEFFNVCKITKYLTVSTVCKRNDHDQDENSNISEGKKIVLMA